MGHTSSLVVPRSQGAGTPAGTGHESGGGRHLVRGYDAGKNVKGRKRHIVVDVLGNLVAAAVHAAGIQDRDGVRLVLAQLRATTKARIRLIWADGAYTGRLAHWVRETLDVLLTVFPRPSRQKGFHLLPRRWVGERTLGWFKRYRRLSKDYERCAESSESMRYIAASHTLIRRLAPCL